jgi:hypothetical protein
MNRKTLVVLICMLLVAIMLAGCGDETPEPVATSAPTATSEPAATATPQPTATSEPTVTPTPEPTATTEPTAAVLDGWEKFEGAGIELWLPESYEGGNLAEDLDVIVGNLRSLGPEFEQMAQLIEQNPTAYVLWAFDSDVGSSGFLTNVNVTTEQILSAVTVETYMDAVSNQLPEQFQVLEQDMVTLGDYEAGRMVLELAMEGVTAKEVLYIVKDGNTVYGITFATGADEFEERLPEFEQSASSFTVQP